MADNNIFILFEEIKQRLETLSKEVSAFKAQAVSLKCKPEHENIQTELLEKYTQQMKDLLNKFISIQVRIKDDELKDIEQCIRRNEKFLADCKQQNGLSKHEHIHRHSFDIKSSKVFVTVIVLSALLLFSLVGNYQLWSRKQQYNDDALKFRIIRVWRGCSAKEILWLNDVFDIHRNKTAIKNIQKEVDGYELGLRHKTDSLMQNQIRVR